MAKRGDKALKGRKSMRTEYEMEAMIVRNYGEWTF